MSQGPHDLGTVAWFRDNHPVVTSTKNDNDINTEPRITVETVWSDALTSRLVISILIHREYNVKRVLVKETSEKVYICKEKMIKE